MREASRTSSGSRGHPTVRSQTWRLYEEQVFASYERLCSRLEGHVKRHRWAKASKVYVASLATVVARVKVGRETWSHRLWLRLATHYETSSVEVIAAAMAKIMSEAGASCIYYMFTMSAGPKGYVGLVEDRAASERLIEHWSALELPPAGDLKYGGMRRQARAWRWMFLPIVATRGVVPVSELRQVENVEINRASPTPWNKTGFMRSRKSSVRSESQMADRMPPAAAVASRPPQMRLECYDLARLELRYDLTSLINTSDRFIVHATRLKVAKLQTVARLYRRSRVRIKGMYRGVRFDGTLRQALRYCNNLGDDVGWLVFTFLQRRAHELDRGLQYRCLVRRATTELRDMCAYLSASSLFSLYWVSRRMAEPDVHVRNQMEIERSLRQKGFLCLPERRLVMRVPPDARVSRLDVNQAVKRMLHSSWVHPNIAASIMFTLAVVYSASATLGSTLNSTKRWIEELEDGSQPRCCCHLYPEHWPRRHGHVCVPSWSYAGRFQSTAASSKNQFLHRHPGCALQKRDLASRARLHAHQNTEL